MQNFEVSSMSPPLYHVSDSANERMENLHFSCPEPRTYKMKKMAA